MSDPKRPVLIELEAEATAADPAAAAPVPEMELPAPTGQAMQSMAALAVRKPSRLWRLFWGSFLALMGFVLSLSAWNFVTALLVANPVLGWIATVLIGLVLFVLMLIALREAAAFARLGRLDHLRTAADTAIAADDLGLARKTVDQLLALYAGRPELRWGRDRFSARRGDVFDADSLFQLAENELLGPLDAAARQEVEAAARQVATVTALVPLAFADVIVALTSNLRMIRRIGEIYGGRGGTLGAWRLTRSVLTHLVATGAVAVGDDLIGSIAGGSVLSRVSRRFGEGIVNGALTARVGVAAMEVCRPLPFRSATRPSVTTLVRRALTGLFGQKA
jgi:putative membrane protein